MPRGQKSVANLNPTSKPKRRCQWCRQDRDTRRFDSHVNACKAKVLSRRKRLADATELAPPPAKRRRCSDVVLSGVRAFNSPDPEILAEPWSTESENIGFGHEGNGPELHLTDTEQDQSTPYVYIKIVPHPHSKDPSVITIPLSGSSQAPTPLPYANETKQDHIVDTPWAPFRNRADFEFTELAVNERLSKSAVNAFLAGQHGSWSTNGTNLTMTSHTDMAESLEAARKYVVEFTTGRVTAEYENQVHEFVFQYRNPWQWICSLVQDPTLADVSVWHSTDKFFCEGDQVERVVDEPWTAETWRTIDQILPPADPYPHAFLPVHVWLDKGLVTKHVKMHPMLLRAGWLPNNIRNASGNGGGIFIAWMPVIADPWDPADRSTAEKIQWARFKREVYQKVLAVIFGPLKRPSHRGEAVTCGDKITRVLYPGILIASLDGEEAAVFCCVRAALANYPCPKCLVHHDDLHRLIASFTPRTPELIQVVLSRAAAETSKHRAEKHLQDYGVHDTEHFLWGFRFSDPYAAYSYDTLHSDDLGKWGKHLWPLLLNALENEQCKGSLTQNMSRVPPWPNLKHFNNVTTVEYADGQAFLDILKCVMPCAVNLLPRNSPLILCIRAYARFRMMVGLHCMTSSRLARLKAYMAEYEKWSTEVGKIYGKEFDFFKQHASSHAPGDIWTKGTTNNFTTRPGEGFQQEAAESYEMTNRKNVEAQMNQRDATQEAIAKIRMTVDDHDRTQQESDSTTEEDTAGKQRVGGRNHCNDSDTSDEAPHWALGSSDRFSTSRELEATLRFRSFHTKLVSFINEHVPGAEVDSERSIKVQPHKYIALEYQSQEDWTSARDILRCNANFHGRERHDCVLVNDDSPHLSCVRLCALLRCTLHGGKACDVAVVNMLHPDSWKPRTFWSNCRVYKEVEEPVFVLPQFFIRGAHMIPAFGCNHPQRLILNDLIDPDMFLRAGN